MNYRIYNYRADSKPRDLDTLAANQVWSSTSAHLNDPFEFAAFAALQDHPDKQREFQDVGVTCFCRSFTNPLLWSHYSASHQGFAIGFDLAHPFFGRDRGLAMSFIHDVRYEDLAPSLEFLSVEDLTMAAPLTKPTCWAYEQELRLIKQQGNQRVDIPADAFKEVLLGARMAPERADEIVRTLRSHGSTWKISRNGPARFRVNGPTLDGLPAEPRFESSTRPFSLKQVFEL